MKLFYLFVNFLNFYFKDSQFLFFITGWKIFCFVFLLFSRLCQKEVKLSHLPVRYVRSDIYIPVHSCTIAQVATPNFERAHLAT